MTARGGLVTWGQRDCGRITTTKAAGCKTQPLVSIRGYGTLTARGSPDAGRMLLLALCPGFDRLLLAAPSLDGDLVRLGPLGLRQHDTDDAVLE